MKRKSVIVVAMAAMVTVARSGHELPVYPSYYPHEIEIAAIEPARAAALLVEGKLHAYVGEPPRFAGPPPDSVQSIESLGAFLVVRANPALANQAAACAAVRAAAADLAGRGGEFVFHPYPVTPMHGDYLHHVDLAEAAKTRLLAAKAATESLALKVRAEAALSRSLVRRAWLVRSGEWDAEIVEVAAAELVGSAAFTINGWLGPPWLKDGWFHAYLLLGATVGEPTKARVESAVQGLQERALDDPAGRVNLERDLVGALVGDCRTLVAGYSLKREYFNATFSAGIENIGFDSHAGMNSAIFLRTTKLKDFPWNGWLALGLAAPATAAWNPVAGFTDPFGRLMWSAIGDPVMLPSPYDSAWLLNRASDVEAVPAGRTE